MLILITIWGVRLSYNLWRKGGFQHLEDYRWDHLKKKMGNTWKFTIFKIFFVCIYQTILNMTLVLPVYYVPKSDLGIWDYFTAGLMLMFIIIEAIADQQQ